MDSAVMRVVLVLTLLRLWLVGPAAGLLPKAKPGSFVIVFDGSAHSADRAGLKRRVHDQVESLLWSYHAAFQPFGIAYVNGFVLHNVTEKQLLELKARVETLGGTIEPNYVTKLQVLEKETPLLAADETDLSPRTTSESCVSRRLALKGRHHLDWLDLRLDRQYCAPGRRSGGVHVFVMDTGVDTTHSELSHVVTDVQDCGDGSSLPWKPWTDIHGHGTHVAGIIASAASGVTPNVVLHSIKVMNDNGEGTTALALCGLGQLEAWLIANPSTKVVVNLSMFVEGRTPFLEAAVKSIVDKFQERVVFVAAAGNGPTDACGLTFAALSEVIAVGSVNKDLKQSSFSNYGSCVDIMAGGEKILSTAPDQSFATKSGTSMAAPVVSAVIAQYWLENPSATGMDIRRSINQTSSRLHASGMLSKLSSDTPNKLIIYNCPGRCSQGKASFQGRCLFGYCTSDGAYLSCQGIALFLPLLSTLLDTLSRLSLALDVQ